MFIRLSWLLVKFYRQFVDNHGIINIMMLRFVMRRLSMKKLEQEAAGETGEECTEAGSAWLHRQSASGS